MILRLLIAGSLLLASCGYHLAGQGSGSVIPEGVSNVSLEAGTTPLEQGLLSEMKRLWQKSSLPALSGGGELASGQQVIIRIEQVGIVMHPVAYDPSGLAIQHTLELSGQLFMDQHGENIWQSGRLVEAADIFGGGDPAVTEAERERLSVQLQQRWVKRAIKSLKSGF